MSKEINENTSQETFGVASTSTTASAQSTMKLNLSAWHLFAAASFARNAGEVELADAGKPNGDFFVENIASNVMAAIFFSVAALEADVNDLFSDSDKHISELNAELTKEIWNLFERNAGILEKYNLMALLKGRGHLDKGTNIHQNAKALIDLRNALVHFKPEWTHEHDAFRESKQQGLKKPEHLKIEELLARKFALSPFVASNSTFFPDKCMSHGCAEWAVQTAVKFRTHFSQITGLPDSFAPYHSRVNTR